MTFWQPARWIGLTVLAVSLIVFGVWSALAIWFRVDATEPVRDLLAGVVVLLTVVAAVCLATSRRWTALVAFGMFFAAMLVWWSTITPSNDRDWQPDVARSVTAKIDGDRLVVSNLRNFNWRSDTDFDERWEERSYSLSQASNVDLILSYWAGEAIAHLIVSIGFDDGSRLAFSIETRKSRDEDYSTVAGFFRQYELSIVAADERDVVRVRSNVRGEDVRIYRLRMPPMYAQELLREYIAEANDVARVPRWYNTLTGNCTTLVFGMIRVIRPGVHFDYRILLSGYLPEYAYDLGAIDTSIPFETLRGLAKIQKKAADADSDPDFSAKIREGLPVPH